ncbi:hypothetical protein FEDK69T_30420 [Flavobacterium enshiense DK69]|uniref:Uncharacterized protein n=1 Tax=Flavobacterium enshiense DK69 TaxID=1107311 RepID=V6S1D7_9FLAO|nr:hypothetical protein FEDK69T_30420 [Flavobacterium enshiense DK69]KGO92611.1 hypothetical protein Q767_15560 [Flavobacterium enshiense DK69]
MTANVPPALCQAGIFITDAYKYTEKFERKNLTSEKKVQAPTIPLHTETPLAQNRCYARF